MAVSFEATGALRRPFCVYPVNVMQNFGRCALSF